MPAKHKHQWDWTGPLFAAWALWVAGCSRETAKAPEPTPAPAATNVMLKPAQRGAIHLQEVKFSSFGKTVDATGTVSFDNDKATTVLAPVSGPVVKLVADLGAKVKAGDVLATAASPDYATAVSAYRKAVLTARNMRRLAQMTQDLSQNNLARKDVEQAQTDAANAEADEAAALEQVRSLGVDETTITAIQENKPVADPTGLIRAPIAGTVVEKLITPGQLLQAGMTPCFTVADLSRVWIMANVFESDLASIQESDPVDIITSASPTNLPGTVDYISAIVDPNTRAIGVRVTAENPGDILKKEMYVRVLIHSRKQTRGLLIPVSAELRNEENLPFVYVAAKDGSFERRRVNLGGRVGNDVEITSGLKEGDQVVIEGGLFIQFTQDQ